MARPRNEELYNRIKREAYHQLLSYGYTDTTYQSIATACGVTRAAVQNYYASKSDLALFFAVFYSPLQTVCFEKFFFFSIYFPFNYFWIIVVQQKTKPCFQ